jgi:hypothetical protein
MTSQVTTHFGSLYGIKASKIDAREVQNAMPNIPIRVEKDYVRQPLILIPDHYDSSFMEQIGQKFPELNLEPQKILPARDYLTLRLTAERLAKLSNGGNKNFPFPVNRNALNLGRKLTPHTKRTRIAKGSLPDEVGKTMMSLYWRLQSLSVQENGQGLTQHVARILNHGLKRYISKQITPQVNLQLARLEFPNETHVAKYPPTKERRLPHHQRAAALKTQRLGS